jgi:hypothetical protein
MPPIDPSAARPRARGVALAVALLAIAAVIAVGCSVVVDPNPPSPTPADFGGIAAALVQAGIKVVHPVAADAGCQDRVLVPTAISFEASGLDQPTPVKIYAYLFADRATFERLRTTVDSCARSYVTDPATYESAEQSPYVIAGQGPWGPQFKAKLRQVLAVTAGNGDS